jgi:hypothetical protein
MAPCVGPRPSSTLSQGNASIAIFPDLFSAVHYLTIPIITLRLKDLLERAVNGRADVGHILPEIDGSDRPLGNALRGELELLLKAKTLAWGDMTEKPI